MKYHCLIYFDPKTAFADTPEARQMMADVRPYSEKYRASGNILSEIPLNLPSTAVTLTNRGGAVATTDGPFMETKELLGGIMVIEARDLNEAIRIAGECPHARLGTVEIRPEIDFSQPRPQF